jgi:hypothetical protein
MGRPLLDWDRITVCIQLQHVTNIQIQNSINSDQNVTDSQVEDREWQKANTEPAHINL